MKDKVVLVPAYLPKSLIFKKILREGVVMAAFSLFVGYALVWNSFQQSVDKSKTVSSFNYQTLPQQFPVSISPETVNGVNLSLKNLNKIELANFVKNYDFDNLKQKVIKLELENNTNMPLAAISASFDLNSCELDQVYIVNDGSYDLGIIKSENSFTYFNSGSDLKTKNLIYLVFNKLSSKNCKVKIDKENTLVSVVGSDKNMLSTVDNNLIDLE